MMCPLTYLYVCHECFGLDVDLFYGGRTQILTAVFLEE